MNSEEMKKLAEEIGRMPKSRRDSFFDMISDARIAHSNKILESDVERTLFGVKLEQDQSGYYDLVAYHADVSEISGIDWCDLTLNRRVIFEEDNSFQIKFEAYINFEGVNIFVEGLSSVEECELKLVEKFYERKSQFASNVNAFEKAFFKKERLTDD